MPGWHAKTKQAREQGKIQTVGIIPEQHPDRTRLFMQWKEMDWPILIDPLNLMEVTAVPLTFLIDEYGVIRYSRPSDEEFEEFLNRTYERPSGSAGSTETAASDLVQLAKSAQTGSLEAKRRYAEALVLWGSDALMGKAIETYEKALQFDPGSGPDHFRLGVAYRKRYDSSERREGDFARAVEHWRRALDIDPNQYIWRRRIQQYGPRLNKPYSFYDWVRQARQELTARGETPLPLSVEPEGAEFAYPVKDFKTSEAREEPDSRGRIHRDEKDFILVETTVVPSTASSDTGRVHLSFRPNLGLKAHWNNEVDEMVVWLNPPDGWQVDSRHLTAPLAPKAVSQEVRKVEFEWKAPADFTGAATIPAYALYYVCEDVDGTCLYRRQDIPVRVEVR